MRKEDKPMPILSTIDKERIIGEIKHFNGKLNEKSYWIKYICYENRIFSYCLERLIQFQ